MARKARVMGLIMATFISVEEEGRKFGFSNNVSNKKEEEEINSGFVCPVVIMPLGNFSKIWALIITLTLMVSGL